MGFALWIDTEADLVWVEGAHEYRPLGTAVVAITDQFRHHDFRPGRRRPKHLERSFAGFFGSLEEVNATLRAGRTQKPRTTPGHLK
jgi:hypothetical protein